MADISEKDYAVNKWLSHSWTIPTSPVAVVEVCYYGGKKEIGLANSFDWAYREKDFIVNWRPVWGQSLDDALGLNAGVTPYVYPQTTFKPSSEAQLRADEEARISNKLSEKLSTISDTLNKITGKNFSVADIKLVKDLLESVEEYEENK